MVFALADLFLFLLYAIVKEKRKSRDITATTYNLEE
jgi:hypothetical protein